MFIKVYIIDFILIIGIMKIDIIIEDKL